MAKCTFNTVGTTKMPVEGSVLEFTDAKTLHDKPISVYIDFETSHATLSQVILVSLSTFFHPPSTALCRLYDSLQRFIRIKATKNHRGVQRKTTCSPTWWEEMRGLSPRIPSIY